MVTIEALVQNAFILFLLIIAGFAIFAKAARYILGVYARKAAERTGNEAFITMLKAITNPLYAIIISAGLYLSLRILAFLAPFTALIDGIFFAVFVLLFSIIISKIANILVNKQLKVQKGFERIPRMLDRAIAAAIYIIAFLIILGYFNIEITPLVASLGLTGLVVGLALQNTLSNFFAGLYIISGKPINIGDFIELPGNASGYVEDIGWRSTRLRTLSDTAIFIPNSMLAGSTVVNDSRPSNKMDVLAEGAVAYGSDLKKAETITIEVAREIQKTAKGAIRGFEPVLRYHTFDTRIKFAVTLRVDNYESKFLVVHEFIKALKERYEKEGIKIG